MSGLEYLRAIARGELPAAPMADLLGFGFHEIEEGRVIFECVPAESHTTCMIFREDSKERHVGEDRR
jgi:hypothetical protein